MKTVIAVLALALLVGGCFEDHSLVGWGLATPEFDSADNAFAGRLGIVNEGIEAGYETSYLGNRLDSQSHGAYLAAELEKTPLGTPYIGYHATLVIGDIEDGAFYGPILGTTVGVAPGVQTVVEYQYRDFTGSLADLQADNNDRHRVFTGLRVKF